MNFFTLYKLSKKLDNCGFFKISDKIENLLLKYSQDNEFYDDEETINKEELEKIQTLEEISEHQKLLGKQKIPMKPPVVQNSLEDLSRINILNSISPFEKQELLDNNKKSVAI